MKKYARYFLYFFLFTIGFFCLNLALFSSPLRASQGQPVRIGVLAFRAPGQTLARWAPTAQYLSEVIKGHSFQFIPMNYPEVNQAVAEQTIDFVLTNTGHYVELEAEHGIARIVTLVKSINNDPVKVFGGVIFTRSERTDLNTIDDLRGKHFMAVGKSSLGGFLVAWEQLKKHGIDPFEDFSRISFNGMPHDQVVMRVLQGDADAGTVRTSVLEHLVREGKIEQDAIKIINQKQTADFSYIHSTELYPEWPFSRMPHTDDTLVEKVTVALLNISREHPAARAGGYDRWTPPMDYQKVHNLMKYLATGPYQHLHSFSLIDVLKRYLLATHLILGGLLIAIGVMMKIVGLNRKLKEAEANLHNIFNSSIPICFTNGDYQVIMANAAYQKIFDHDPKKGAPIKCYESRPGKTCQTEACPMKRVFSGEEEVVCEPTKTNPDGTEQHFIVTARPFRNSRGKLIGIVESFQDITGRKEAEMERDRLLEKLQKALSEIKTLRGILPICSFCKKIRDDKGYWQQVEVYVKEHTDAKFSHSFCPECAKIHYTEFVK